MSAGMYLDTYIYDQMSNSSFLQMRIVADVCFQKSNSPLNSAPILPIARLTQLKVAVGRGGGSKRFLSR